MPTRPHPASTLSSGSQIFIFLSGTSHPRRRHRRRHLRRCPRPRHPRSHHPPLLRPCYHLLHSRPLCRRLLSLRRSYHHRRRPHLSPRRRHRSPPNPRHSPRHRHLRSHPHPQPHRHVRLPLLRPGNPGSGGWITSVLQERATHATAVKLARQAYAAPPLIRSLGCARAKGNAAGIRTWQSHCAPLLMHRHRTFTDVGLTFFLFPIALRSSCTVTAHTRTWQPPFRAALDAPSPHPLTYD